MVLLVSPKVGLGNNCLMLTSDVVPRIRRIKKDNKQTINMRRGRSGHQNCYYLCQINRNILSNKTEVNQKQDYISSFKLEVKIFEVEA